MSKEAEKFFKQEWGITKKIQEIHLLDSEMDNINILAMTEDNVFGTMQDYAESYYKEEMERELEWMETLLKRLNWDNKPFSIRVFCKHRIEELLNKLRK